MTNVDQTDDGLIVATAENQKELNSACATAEQLLVGLVRGLTLRDLPDDGLPSTPETVSAAQEQGR